MKNKYEKYVEKKKKSKKKKICSFPKSYIYFFYVPNRCLNLIYLNKRQHVNEERISVQISKEEILDTLKKRWTKKEKERGKKAHKEIKYLSK